MNDITVTLHLPEGVQNYANVAPSIRVLSRYLIYLLILLVMLLTLMESLIKAVRVARLPANNEKSNSCPKT